MSEEIIPESEMRGKKLRATFQELEQEIGRLAELNKYLHQTFAINQSFINEIQDSRVKLNAENENLRAEIAELKRIQKHIFELSRMYYRPCHNQPDVWRFDYDSLSEVLDQIKQDDEEERRKL